MQSTIKDITKEPLGLDKDRNNVYLDDVWPDPKLVTELLDKIEADLYINRYKNLTIDNLFIQSIITTYNVLV